MSEQTPLKAENEQSDPGPYHCPTCGAAGRNGCATSTGRDHPTRALWIRAYAAGRRSVLTRPE